MIIRVYGDADTTTNRDLAHLKEDLPQFTTLPIFECCSDWCEALVIATTNFRNF